MFYPQALAVFIILSLMFIPGQSFLVDDDATTAPQSPLHLTFTPTTVTRGITPNVTLQCKHDGVTPSQLWEVTRIRIMRQTATGWSLFVQKTLANRTNTTDHNVSVSGLVTQSINDTFLEVEWALADFGTFGTYRCDVMGLDSDLNQRSESSPEVTLQERPVTNDDLLTLLLKTREEMAELARDVNRRLDHVDRDIEAMKDDALQKKDVAGWPQGNYALLRPGAGCPVDLTFLGGDDSYFVVHTESSSDTKNSNRYTKALPLSTTTKINGNVNLFTLRFCEARREFNTRRWPAGSYCIDKIPTKPCPSGFSYGEVNLDVEDTNTTSDLRGNVVKDFGDKAKLEFCCRQAGSPTYRMRLPTNSPFILYRKGGTCQQVYGMKVSDESITIDTEDTNNGDTVGGTIPDVYTVNISSKPLMFALCYYTKI